MNVRRFVGKNAREAMAQARAAFGDQAVVLSNRPVPGGVEMIAMASAEVADATDPPAPATGATTSRPEGMSTLSFQEFVRERQRRDAASQREPARADPELSRPAIPDEPAVPQRPTPARRPIATEPGRFATQALQAEAATAPRAADQVVDEIKAMRNMIAGQLASLAWFDGVRRQPEQTGILRLLLGNGFSPQLARQLVTRLPQGSDAAQAQGWLREVLARNLRCSSADGILATGGVHALVGPTGVGKTTTTAKLAARFAMAHGPGSVGLITVDTYRMAATDQLRAYGRLLNIPVHTAADATSLLDLLDLLSSRKLVLIDTVGVGQRDRRLAELLQALPQQRVARVLVLNAAAQGETLDEVVRAYGAQAGSRCIISKLDEAARCGAVVDVAVRHQLRVEGFCNGQRVPEDWHAARADLLAQKALMKPAAAAFEHDDAELGLLLTAPPAAPRAGASRA